MVSLHEEFEKKIFGQLFGSMNPWGKACKLMSGFFPIGLHVHNDQFRCEEISTWYVIVAGLLQKCFIGEEEIHISMANG